MNNTFETFYTEFIIFDIGYKTKSSDIGKCFNEFNNGNGKNKFFAFLKDVKQIKKSTANEFLNIRLRNEITNQELVKEKIKEPIEEPIEEKVVNVNANREDLELELLKIRIENERNLYKVEAEKEEKRIQAEAEKEEKRIQVELKKIELKYEIENKKLLLKEKKIESYEKQQNLNRVYGRETNNRYRDLSFNVTNNYGPLSNLEVYGNFHDKTFSSDSVSRNLVTTQMKHNNINMANVKDILYIVDTETEKKDIYTIDDKFVNKNVIDINKLDTIVDKVKKNDNLSGCNKLNNKLNEMKSYRDEINNNKESNYLSLGVKSFNEHIHDNIDNKLKNGLSKYEYMRNDNNPRYVNDKQVIDCYLCGVELELKSNGTHKCHDKPASKGGSWDRKNIYLCCSTCNQDMGTMTIREYRFRFFNKSLNVLCNEVNELDEDSIKNKYNIIKDELLTLIKRLNILFDM